MEQNHEYHVSFGVAKLLKEAGFNWECRGYFDDIEFHPNGSVECTNYNSNTCKYLKAPTLDVAQRWLREVKNIAVYVCPSYELVKFVAPNVVADDEKWIIKWQVAALPYDIEADEIDLGDVERETIDTYEGALDAGIKKALETILEKGE